MNILAFLFAVVASLGTMNAPVEKVDAHPTVAYPLERIAGDDKPAMIQIEGSRNTGVRKFAREIDRQIAGVKVFTKGNCFEKLATCVRVVKRHYGDTDWYAQTTFPAYNVRIIQVNLDNPHPKPYAVIAHEFGHVLGLDHHAEKKGVDGATPNIIHLSRNELRALRAAYSKGN